MGGATIGATSTLTDNAGVRVNNKGRLVEGTLEVNTVLPPSYVAANLRKLSDPLAAEFAKKLEEIGDSGKVANWVSFGPEERHISHSFMCYYDINTGKHHYWIYTRMEDYALMTKTVAEGAKKDLEEQFVGFAKHLVLPDNISSIIRKDSL